MQRKSLFLAIALLCLGAVAIAAPSDELQREKLKQLRQQINGLQQHMQQDKSRFAQLSKTLQQSEKAIGDVTQALRSLTKELKQTKRRLAKLRATSKAQRKALSNQRIALARQVRAAFAMGRQERVKVLLNQEDPAVVSRMMAYYDYLNRARLSRMTALTEQLNALEKTEQQILAEESQIATMHNESKAKQQSLQKAQNQRHQIIAKLSNKIQSQDGEMKRLRANEGQLTQLLKGLQQVISDIKLQPKKQVKFRSRKGRLNWPAKGKISANFGSKKIGGLVWDGMLITAPEGREIRAIHNGRVAFADWLRGFGLLIIVDHGDGYMSLYGHNQSLFKDAGDWVEAGDTLAAMGKSGGQKNSAMYFAIRHKGKAVNPKKWCKRIKGRRVG